jgi:hypothetical protein
MRKIFLSHSFNDRDRELVGNVEVLLRSHGLVATNGRTLGGGGLTPEIERVIEDADAFVALLTLRENDPPNVTHPWVLAEFAKARLSSMVAIGLYETGVPVAGFDMAFEHIPLDVAAPLDGLLRLSATIGEWRRRYGRLLKVQVLPAETARRVGARIRDVIVEYRFQRGGNETEWSRAKAFREAYGVFVQLRVPDDAEMVQIKANGPSLAFETPYTPLFVPMQFEEA